MSERVTPRWLDWAREIAALSQIGLHFVHDEYDRLRYKRLQNLSAEILASYSDLPVEQFLQVLSAQAGYATPKVDVRAAVFRDSKLLMVRERSDGGWTMPGGWADVGDVPSQAAERETWEEAGFRVQARKLLGVYDANRAGPLELFHAYKLIYLCELLDGQATPSLETTEVAFFSAEAVPGNLSGERTLPRHIQDAFLALANPQLPTVFD